MSYPKTLKARVIRDYVLAHARTPNPAQLAELLFEAARTHPHLDAVGFSGTELVRPGYHSTSSAEIRNQVLRAEEEDLQTLSRKLDTLEKQIEESYRGFKGTADRVLQATHRIDARLNRLLILQEHADPFSYGIEEDFTDHAQINLERTDAEVGPGYVTMRRRDLELVDLARMSITSSASSQAGLLGTQVRGTPESLKRVDGQVFEYQVETRNALGRTQCWIELRPEEPIEVGVVKVMGSVEEQNSPCTLTVLYTLDAQAWKAVRPVEQRFRPGENLVPVGLSGVKGLRLMLSKQAADEPTPRKSLFRFRLDQLEILTQKGPGLASTLYAGPYEVLDPEGNPVSFTLARLDTDTCCHVPEGATVSFFLSKDGESWVPVSYRGDALSVAEFSRSDAVTEFLDSSRDPDALVASVPLDRDLDLEFGREALLNRYVGEEYAAQVPLASIVVRRNLPQTGVDLYGVASGWFLDPQAQQVFCHVEVDQPEGRWIDLGPTGAFLNGRRVAGRVKIPQGDHRFETSLSNFASVPEGLETIEELEREDPLYPYNHKLLIEGYRYPSGYEGARPYQGVDRHYGARLEYMPPERFQDPETDQDLQCFTVERYDSGLYLKVKIPTSDGSYRDELCEATLRVPQDEGHLLYVKALLTAPDAARVPQIRRFRVRVI